jgi:hypothetical protein
MPSLHRLIEYPVTEFVRQLPVPVGTGAPSRPACSVPLVGVPGAVPTQFDNIPANVTANGLAVAPSPGDKFAVALNVHVPAPAALAADGHNEQPNAATSGTQHLMIALLTWFLSVGGARIL